MPKKKPGATGASEMAKRFESALRKALSTPWDAHRKNAAKKRAKPKARN